MGVWLGDYACDKGLSAFEEANGLFLCSQLPTTFAEAINTYALAGKEVPTGDFVLDPVNEGTVRKIIVPSIVNGDVFGEGVASLWAAVDSINSRLIASGTLTNPIPVRPGQRFSLSSWDIQIDRQLVAPFISLTARTNDLSVAPVLPTPALARRVHMVAIPITPGNPRVTEWIPEDLAPYLAPPGMHWDFVVDDNGVFIYSDGTMEPIVNLVAD